MINKIIIRWNTYILLISSIALLSGCIGGGGSSGGAGGVGSIGGALSTLSGSISGNGSSFSNDDSEDGSSFQTFGLRASFSGDESSEDESSNESSSSDNKSEPEALTLEEAWPGDGASSGDENGPSLQALILEEQEVGNNGETGETIAQIHNPEPATMLLFGSGMMGFGVYKRRRNIK